MAERCLRHQLGGVWRCPTALHLAPGSGDRAMAKVAGGLVAAGGIGRPCGRAVHCPADLGPVQCAGAIKRCCSVVAVRTVWSRSASSRSLWFRAPYAMLARLAGCLGLPQVRRSPRSPRPSPLVLCSIFSLQPSD